MLNLTTSKKTVEAKMRVKSNILGACEDEELDHQVREMRNVVEYTSLGLSLLSSYHVHVHAVHGFRPARAIYA